MESVLGQTSRSIICTRFTTLSEELSKVASCSSTKVIIVSCLSNIIESLASSNDVKTGIERAMLLIGNQFHEIARLQHGSVRIFVAPCTPRNVQDYATHVKFAQVVYVY